MNWILKEYWLTYLGQEVNIYIEYIFKLTWRNFMNKLLAAVALSIVSINFYGEDEGVFIYVSAIFSERRV